MKFPHSAVELIPFYPSVCSHHTFAVRYFLLRCLTGSCMTILSKLYNRVRLNVNMDIADSISFNFNFTSLRSWAKTTLLRQSANRVNEQSKCCDRWLKRERGRNLSSSFAIIWKLSRQNKIRKITSFPLTPRLYKTFQTTGQEIPWIGHNTIKDRKNFHLFLNSLSLLQVTAIYFARLIFSRTSETKSSNWYVMVFQALTYKKYLPKIMRWLRTKQ